MVYKILILSIVCLLPGSFLRAQEAKLQYPIDKSFEECLAKDTSAGNLYNCAFEAYASWDRMMDKEYKKLLRNLKTEKDRAAMKQAQSSWITYRDNEFRTYDNMFNKPGSRWIRLRAEGRIDIVRTRALQLKQYNEELEKRMR